MAVTKKRSHKGMLIPTCILAVLAFVFTFIAYRSGEAQHIAGLRMALNMTLSIIPLLVFAFIVAGMVQVILPRELLSKWVGEESGLRGILIGSIAGGLAPGGPYVSLPVAAGLLRTGAGVGTMVAFLTGWSVWAINRLPLEVGILGWKFTLIRFASTVIFPPIAGFIAQMLFGGARIVD
jgi:uncharacterized membrane protein YraQ (UPF0718 family)